eukprot:241976-Chlamydomonas_euryale.AAC.10
MRAAASRLDRQTWPCHVTSTGRLQIHKCHGMASIVLSSFTSTHSQYRWTLLAVPICQNPVLTWSLHKCVRKCSRECDLVLVLQDQPWGHDSRRPSLPQGASPPLLPARHCYAVCSSCKRAGLSELTSCDVVCPHRPSHSSNPPVTSRLQGPDLKALRGRRQRDGASERKHGVPEAPPHRHNGRVVIQTDLLKRSKCVGGQDFGPLVAA